LISSTAATSRFLWSGVRSVMYTFGVRIKEMDDTRVRQMQLDDSCPATLAFPLCSHPHLAQSSQSRNDIALLRTIDETKLELPVVVIGHKIRNLRSKLRGFDKGEHQTLTK
jgi:hypothetical protein